MHNPCLTRLHWVKVHKPEDTATVDDETGILFEVGLVGVDVGIIVDFDGEGGRGVTIRSDGRNVLISLG